MTEDRFQPRRRREQVPVGKLFERLPPHSIEAEMALLGSVIIAPKVMADLGGLGASDFYLEKHIAIYAALAAVVDRQGTADLVQVVDQLTGEGKLELVGGPEYLSQLAESVPSAVNAPHYAQIVADKARLRRLIEAAGQILHDAYHAGEHGPDAVREIIDEAERRIFQVAELAESGRPESIAELLDAELDRIDRRDPESERGILTGFDDLDAMTSGLQPGDLIIVAARPSMGKTSFAMNVAEQAAFNGRAPGTLDLGSRIPVGVFSLEMSKAALTQRFISARSSVGTQELRASSRMPDTVYKKVLSAAGELRTAPIQIDDTPSLTLTALRARARRMVAEHKVRIIVIDYLQLLTSPTEAKESRQVEVSTISRGIKALARELNVPIVCLAQLNRASEQRASFRPRMSDLRESGSIEQDADVIILLHREEYYHTEDPGWAQEYPEKVGIAEIIVAKQRNGPTGVVRTVWDSTATRFRNYTPSAGDIPV